MVLTCCDNIKTRKSFQEIRKISQNFENRNEINMFGAVGYQKSKLGRSNFNIQLQVYIKNNPHVSILICFCV